MQGDIELVDGDDPVGIVDALFAQQLRLGRCPERRFLQSHIAREWGMFGDETANAGFVGGQAELCKQFENGWTGCSMAGFLWAANR